MQISSSPILDTKESSGISDFNNDSDNKILNTQLSVATLVNETDENSYEEICEDFEDDINGYKFQTVAANTDASTIINADPNKGNSDNSLGELLDFIKNNKDSVAEKLNGTKTYTKPEEEIEDGAKYNINKKIEASSQGKIGDCWLLAGLNSLSFSKEGKEIIKDSIINNGDGTYKVYFKGVKVSCKVTTEDLDKARASKNYSTGDDDVLLFEIAAEKFLRALQDKRVDDSKFASNAPEFLYGENGNPLNGGFPNDILYLMVGKNADYKIIKDKGFNLESFYDRIEYNPDNSAACLHIKPDNNWGFDTLAKDIYGQTVVLTKDNDNHAWSIKSVEEDVVTMVNPWNSNDEVMISKQELKNNVLGYEYLAV